MSTAMSILSQFSDNDVVWALMLATPSAGDDDPLRCTRWDHVLDGCCPFRADNEDGSCTPCRMIEPSETW